MRSKFRREKLYVIYSRDKYELPIVTGSSPMEISSKTNMSYTSVIEIFSRAKKNGGILDGREYRVFNFIGAKS